MAKELIDNYDLEQEYNNAPQNVKDLFDEIGDETDYDVHRNLMWKLDALGYDYDFDLSGSCVYLAPKNPTPNHIKVYSYLDGSKIYFGFPYQLGENIKMQMIGMGGESVHEVTGFKSYCFEFGRNEVDLNVFNELMTKFFAVNGYEIEFNQNLEFYNETQQF